MNLEKKQKINALLVGLKNNSPNALEALYFEMSATLRFIALKYLKNEMDADDLVQDFWADIYKIADGFVFVQNGYQYLCKVMTRKAINRYNKIHHTKEIKLEFVDYTNIYVHLDDDNISNKILIEKALELLDSDEKIIIQLTYFEDKTVRQIAHELKISKSLVSKKKINAINKMKQFID